MPARNYIRQLRFELSLQLSFSHSSRAVGQQDKSALSVQTSAASRPYLLLVKLLLAVLPPAQQTELKFKLKEAVNGERCFLIRESNVQYAESFAW